MAYSSDGKNVKIANLNGKTWYHGSQIELKILKAGSSITRNKQLAIAFSHRPTQVSIDNNGNITHNGQVNGFLYVINEELNEEDYKVHSACDMNDPWELVTLRELKVRLITKTKI